ncbi:MAG: hypothetical protein AAF351_10000 [Pseudomonadota bacterium]
MSTPLAFYVTQGSLTVWDYASKGASEVAMFSDNDDGLRQFEDFLVQQTHRSTLIIIDVIEEEFAIETVPKLSLRDRKALLQRRLQRKFSRTPYRLPLYHGGGKEDEPTVIHSAITNHELLDPWLQIILRHEVALTGIFSVPLMAADLSKKFHKTSGPALVLAQHQEQKLRQIFINDGFARSARLSQSPPLVSDDYATFVATEIGRSRRYLERTRLLSNTDLLDIYVIADRDVSDRISELVHSDSPMKLHMITVEQLASQVGLRRAPPADRLEGIFIAAALRRRPKHSYGVSGENRFWKMRRLRHSIIGSCIAAAASFAVITGITLSDAWTLNSQSAEAEQQLLQLTETFRRENENYDPIKADSHEMKLAVDTGDFILENRLPVPWVMQQIGLVMGDYTDVHIQSLSWTAASPTPEPQPRRGDAPLPVPVAAITEVNADITAQLVPFDGNLRDAFARIDALVADLEARTAFSDVIAVEYPIETRPQSSVSGEIVDNGNQEAAGFKLRLRYPLQPATASVGDDDAV